MWNDLNLSSPIQDICEYGKKDTATIESLSDLVTILTSSAEILTKEHPIWEEVKIFKNVQTKYKKILHCDKCLQYLERVSTCLRKMVLLNISSIYLDLSDKIIMELQTKKAPSYFLPSRQQLEYVLIRTQAAAKLICECLHYSREAFCYLIERLKVGHLIINLMMATSVTARLNIVFKGLLVQIYDTYKRIYPWRKRLKKGGWEWPQLVELPDDLEAWINLKDSEYLKPKHLPKEELEFLMTIFDKNTHCGKEDQEVAPVNGSKPAEEEECMVIDSIDEDNGVLIARPEVEFVEEPVLLQSSPSASKITEPVSSPSSTNALQFLELVPSSSSDEQAVAVEKSQKLSKAQKILLKKIKSAEDLKELKVIWENLDFSAQDLLPQAMTPENIRFIDKMLLKSKRKISKLKKSKISEGDKKKEMGMIVKICRLKFAKTLGLLSTNLKVKKNTKIALKPVKTFKELKELYDTIYQRLQTSQDYKRCGKLKKTFKSRKADMTLLVESGEKKEAKRLIFSTSKLLITDYS